MYNITQYSGTWNERSGCCLQVKLYTIDSLGSQVVMEGLPTNKITIYSGCKVWYHIRTYVSIMLGRYFRIALCEHTPTIVCVGVEYHACNEVIAPLIPREMLLVASTKEDRHRWMTKLQSVNPNLHPHSDTPYDTPENSPFPHHREPPQRSITTSSEDHDTLCVVEHSDEECPNEEEEQACQTNSDSTDSDDHTPKTNKDNDEHTPERNENKDNHASATEKDNKETSKTKSDKESEAKTTQ